MTLHEARQIVFSHKPVFAKLYKKYKNKTWIEYANENFPKQNKEKLSPELLHTFKSLLIPLVGEQTAGSAKKELERSRFVSTCDHHGILWHPFFMNSALLRSRQTGESEVTISLTCGGVSLSNSSHPRGVMYHTTNLDEIHIPFVPRSNSPVYGYPALPKGEFTRKFKHIKENERDWDQKYLSDQFVTLNDVLWRQVFGSSRGSLIYLQAESLVRKLLLDYHLDTETIINKILFDSTTRHAYVEHYNGVVGAHTEKAKGTHFFWYVTKEHKRVQLWLEQSESGSNLVSSDNSITIPLTPQSIRKELQNYQLLPSMALCYSMLSFYYGLTLGGGFSQIQYLGDMKQAYKKVTGKESTVRTDIFTGEFVAIGLFNKKKTVPASLIDLLLYGKGDIGDIIDQRFESVTVGESLDLMMPEFVHIITGTLPTITDLPKVPETFYVT